MPLVHRCPKCGTYFEPPRAEASDCPQCGIWFHKWNVTPAVTPAPTVTDTLPDEVHTVARDPLSYYGRVVALVLVATWGIRLAAMDYRGGEIGGSFMHNILLPIHEAGHVFLMPFGEFMMILGGSLFQVALPLAIGAAFLLRQRDAFGAAMCLWWAGASLVDLAPYIWDSLVPQLTLLGGYTGEDGPHDWIYLLGRLGALSRAHSWGVAAHHLGTLIMAGGVVWGAWWLRKMAPGRRERHG
jgi:hypothetical protein